MPRTRRRTFRRRYYPRRRYAKSYIKRYLRQKARKGNTTVAKCRFVRTAVCDSSGNYYMKVHLMNPVEPWTDTNSSAVNPVTDWASFSELFDNFRVCAIKVKWIPSNNSTPAFNSSTPGLIGNLYAPMYSCIDYDSSSGQTKTLAQVIEYENMKVHNLYRPFTRFFRVPKYLANPISDPSQGGDPVLARGYFPTDPLSGMRPNFGWLYLLTEGNLPTVGTLGQFIVTYYIAFKNRR